MTANASGRQLAARHLAIASHAERSTIISTNLVFKQWGTWFRDACVAVLVDRFNEH
jgi:hypothetical protein